MARLTKLRSPYPRKTHLDYQEFPYIIGTKIYLSHPPSLRNIPFEDVLESRQSRRQFNGITEQQLSSLLWYSARTRLLRKASDGKVMWQHRPAPSGGGKHPIDLLISNYADPGLIYLYDPLAHCLCELSSIQSHKLHNLLQQADQVLKIDGAALIWFAAQFGRTLSKYTYGESIVWRDAGALLATLSFVAAAIGLNFCALGLTGEPSLSQLLDSGNMVLGVGGCLVGKPSELQTRI
jgi:SagB-type dehydrogenase family enzyme